jgi:hypothetical protein
VSNKRNGASSLEWLGIERSIVNQEDPLVLDICYLISKTGPHDVRWEKVERIKRILTGGTYSVPPKQVATKLLERMLERGRAMVAQAHNEAVLHVIGESGPLTSPSISLLGNIQQLVRARIGQGQMWCLAFWSARSTLLLLFHIALRFRSIDSMRYSKPDESTNRTERETSTSESLAGPI